MNRRKQYIIPILVLVGVLSLTIGFASFSSNLVINPEISVNPDANSFKVVFSKSATSEEVGDLNPTTGAGTTATIDNTRYEKPTISNLKANFITPGEASKYEFYAYNAGEYKAYLTNIAFNNVTGTELTKKCIAGNGTSQELVDEACEGISMYIDIDGLLANETMETSGHSIEKGASHKVVITIEYNIDAARADGPFTVTFGDLQVTYSSVEGKGTSTGGLVGDVVAVNYLMVNEKVSSGDTTFLGNSVINRSQVESIEIKDTIEIPTDAYSWDVSEAQNGSVMAWYIDSDGNDLYELYIGQEGGVRANPDSSNLFRYFTKVKEINLEYLNTSNVSTMYSMFYYCQALTNLNLSNFNTVNVTNMAGMFSRCESLTSLDLRSFNTRNVTTMLGMFQSSYNLSELNISSFNTSNVTSMRAMFNYCSNLTSLDLSHFDTSKVTTMYSMFAGCSNLTNLNISKFNTSSVETMQTMFSVLEKLENLDLSHFDTGKVTNMSGMFAGSSGLKSINLSGFDTSNVTDMSHMFGGAGLTGEKIEHCTSLETLDLSDFDTKNVTTMKEMFYGATNLKTINMTKATFNSVTNYSEMFTLDTALTSIIVEDDDAITWVEARIAESGLSTIVSKP